MAVIAFALLLNNCNEIGTGNNLRSQLAEVLYGYAKKINIKLLVLRGVRSCE